jgi:hypothetical protein
VSQQSISKVQDSTQPTSNKGKDYYDNLKWEHLELVSEPAGQITHVCWSCMKVKALMVGSENKTVYQLWDCCDE